MPGRLGAAAIYGSAVYADACGAACASGHGEPLVISSLAKVVVQGISDRMLSDIVMDGAMRDSQKGVICARRVSDSKVEVSWNHDTPSFAIGFAWYDAKSFQQGSWSFRTVVSRSKRNGRLTEETQLFKVRLN
mmetsp:Transcript_27197/g.68217  ORF Transcript_27197/g.68217 Transcript_27197/m.68217 type:complete len:133 (+) Transcript_27197:754-1152(+)